MKGCKRYQFGSDISDAQLIGPYAVNASQILIHHAVDLICRVSAKHQVL